MTQLRAYIFGNIHTGKTELLKHLHSQNYINDPKHLYKPTKEAKFSSITIQNKGSAETILIEFCDMGGHLHFKPLMQTYATGIDLGLYCIDLSIKIDDAKLQQIKNDITLFKKINPDAQLILVGTKRDIALKDSLETVKKQLSDIDFTAAVSTSARELEGSKELYNVLHAEANKKWLPTDEEYCDFHSPINAIERARNRCNINSDLYHALDNLNNKALSLPYKSFEALAVQVNILLDDLANTSISDKTQSINTFSKNCSELLDGKYYQVKRAIAAIATTAFVASISALIGFSIGFALGAWSGPGAFFSGLITGCSQALAVAEGSAISGLGTFALSAHYFFKTTPIMESVNDVAEKAIISTPISP